MREDWIGNAGDDNVKKKKIGSPGWIMRENWHSRVTIARRLATLGD